jgi:hypothetical protein
MMPFPPTLIFQITAMPEAGSTQHENPPHPPFGKGGMGGIFI